MNSYHEFIHEFSAMKKIMKSWLKSYLKSEINPDSAVNISLLDIQCCEENHENHV